MTKRRVSISDIAKEVGVSPSTVSRALSDHHAISTKIKERVREVANELNYVPNSVAVNLKSGRKNSIGVIVPIIRRNFFASAIEGIEDFAHTKGYNVIICQSKDSATREKELVNSLSGKVDGIIASLSSENKSHCYYNTLSQINIPLVMFDRTDKEINASTVTIDDYMGAKLAVEHLLEQGMKKIYHFAGPQSVSIWKNRNEGYLAAMNKAGIEVCDNWIHTAPTTTEEGELFAKELISKGDMPEAIFFSGDYAALGALMVFKANRVRVPQDIAIVGFANEPFCEIISPSLSSIEQFSYRMGQVSCKMLFERFDGEPPLNTIIAPELIIRESSKK